MRSPFKLLYISFINLILIPVLGYFLIFMHLDINLAVGLLLLAALPTGVSSVAFTDIMQGRTSLNLTIVIVSNLLAVFTIPLLFWVFFQHELGINYSSLFFDLLQVIFIPFCIAKVLKHVILKNVAVKLHDYYNVIVLALLSLMMMITISIEATYIIANFYSLLRTLGILFVAFFLFHIVGYSSLFWLKKGERLAMSNATMIMNNVLGIVLAIAFFNQEVTTIIILSFIPWSLMIMAKHWYKRFLP